MLGLNEGSGDATGVSLDNSRKKQELIIINGLPLLHPFTVLALVFCGNECIGVRFQSKGKGGEG